MFRLAVACAVVLSTSAAFATTGGPTEIDLLGYDAKDHKIYFVETHHDESGRMPQIYFVRTEGARIGKLVRVASIQRGVVGSPDPDGVLGARVDKLRERLETLPPLGGEPQRDDDARGRVSDRVGRALGLTRKRTGTELVPDLDESPHACAVVELGLTHGERSGQLELRECHPGSSGVVSAYAIPTTARRSSS